MDQFQNDMAATCRRKESAKGLVISATVATLGGGIVLLGANLVNIQMANAWLDRGLFCVGGILMFGGTVAAAYGTYSILKHTARLIGHGLQRKPKGPAV